MKTKTDPFSAIEQLIANSDLEKADKEIQAARVSHKDDAYFQAKLYLLNGKLFSKTRNSAAHICYDEGVQICSNQIEQRFNSLLAEIYFNKARDFQLQGDLKQALTYYNNSLAIVDKENDFKLYFYLNNNIAILYRNLGVESYALSRLIETRDNFKTLSPEKFTETQNEYYRVIFNIAMHYIYHAGDLAFALEYLLLSYDFYLSIDSTFEIISIGNETIETLCKLGRISEAEQFYQTLLAHFKSKGEQSQYIQFCFLLSEFTIAIGKKELKLQQEILVPLRQKLSHFNNKKELIIGYIPNLLLHYTNLFLATNDVSQIDSTFNKEIKLYLDAIKTESNFLTFNTLELVYKFYTLTNLKGKDSFFVFYIDYIQKTNALRNDVLLHDIKVKYQTNAILEKLNSEKELNIKLKEINNSLTNFAAIAAHDLKAPLRTISDFSRILSNRYASVIAPEDKIMFDFIIKGAGNLNNLINDLLAFSKLEYNRMDNSIVDLDSILKEVTQILSSSIKDCSAQIQYTSLPRVKGQSTLLAQLFLNLINNSIKFRKKDEQLVIQIKCEKENDKYFTISFTDNGIGIDKPQHNAVFEPFKKLHSSSEYEGNGIGLATCKKIITFYGGTIHIESELGKGTNIIFTLLRAD